MKMVPFLARGFLRSKPLLNVRDLDAGCVLLAFSSDEKFQHARQTRDSLDLDPVDWASVGYEVVYAARGSADEDCVLTEVWRRFGKSPRPGYVLFVVHGRVAGHVPVDVVRNWATARSRRDARRRDARRDAGRDAARLIGKGLLEQMAVSVQ